MSRFVNKLNRIVFYKYTNVILQAAGETIPNKIITVRKTEPSWMNGAIRRAIRKRNRFQRQAKKSNLPVHWANFRKSRNKTIALRIAPFIHEGSVFRTVIILLGIVSPAACNITFENDSHKSSKLFPE
jgi:hypothetical protein